MARFYHSRTDGLMIYSFGTWSLELSHVDVGDGWLIFGLPTAEVAVHEADAQGSQSGRRKAIEKEDGETVIRLRGCPTNDALYNCS